MTKEFFWNNVEMAVEIEYEDGFRRWFTMKNEEVESFLNNLKTDEYLSDVDFCSHQTNEEIRGIIDRAEKVFFGGAEYKSLNDAIDAVLEEEKPRRVWTAEEIKDLVQTNDRVLYGALKKLYECQTDDEKLDGAARHNNGAGFNGVDAPILTSFTEFLLKTGFLTPKQKILARKKLIKYTRQLVIIANNPV